MFSLNQNAYPHQDLKTADYQNRIAMQRYSNAYEPKPLQDTNIQYTSRTTKSPDEMTFQRTKSRIEELQHIINELQANRNKTKVNAYKTENPQRAISQNRQTYIQSPHDTSPISFRGTEKALDYSTNHPNNMETWLNNQVSEFTTQRVEKSRMLTPPLVEENKHSDLFTRYINNIKMSSPKFKGEDETSSRKQFRPSVSPVIVKKPMVTQPDYIYQQQVINEEEKTQNNRAIGAIKQNDRCDRKDIVNLTCLGPKKSTPTPTPTKSENSSQQIGLASSVLPESLITQNLDCFNIGKVLGLGSYAVVRLAVHKTSGIQMAIKTYEKSKLVDQQKRKNVTREMKILSKLRHINIIKLHQACETNSQLHLVMEYTTSNSLNTYLKTKASRKISEDEARLIFRQVVDAIRYCHNKNVVHRDIKLENILVDEKRYIKLIDFGFSIAIDPATKLNVFCGTPSYMAPEIVNKVHYSFPADVWALGILLYKMITGTFPFRGTDDKELYRRINSGKIDFPAGVSTSGKLLVQKLLRVNQQDRPSAKEVLSDDWFSIRNSMEAE